MRGYGSELFGFLMTLHRDETEAAETFSDFAEAMLRNLPRFRWGSSARTWAYAIARNLARKRWRDDARRRRRMADVGASGLDALAQRVRTETLSFLRTEKRTRLQVLRDSLSEEDRMILLLRVERGLTWPDIARVLAGDSELDDAAMSREAARVRKRYQLVKDRLRAKAKQQGLLE